MKIRNGFVSNSSSSSFVIIGVRTTLNKIDFSTKGVHYLAETNLEFGEGGRNFIRITNQEVLNLIKQHPQIVDDIYKVLKESDSCIDITDINPPKGEKLFALGGEMNQHVPSSVEELNDIFEYNGMLPEEEDEEEDEEKEFIRLECTEGTSNKFYEMRNIDDEVFEVRYGRIGSDGKEEVYNMADWDSILLKKLKKGYKIV